MNNEDNDNKVIPHSKFVDRMLRCNTQEIELNNINDRLDSIPPITPTQEQVIDNMILNRDKIVNILGEDTYNVLLKLLVEDKNK